VFRDCTGGCGGWWGWGWLWRGGVVGAGAVVHGDESVLDRVSGFVVSSVLRSFGLRIWKSEIWKDNRENGRKREKWS